MQKLARKRSKKEKLSGSAPHTFAAPLLASPIGPKTGGSELETLDFKLKKD